VTTLHYWRTHAHPGSTFKYTMSSLPDLMRWDLGHGLALRSDVTEQLPWVEDRMNPILYLSADHMPITDGRQFRALHR